MKSSTGGLLDFTKDEAIIARDIRLTHRYLPLVVVGAVPSFIAIPLWHASLSVAQYSAQELETASALIGKGIESCG